jgi:hypothetical protein
MISKFALACVAAIFTGGVSAGLTAEGSVAPVQVKTSESTTPIAAIGNPLVSFQNVSVQLISGKPVGRVVAIATNAQGRATRVRVELADMPSEAIWLDQNDLVYSRSHNVIVAHDVHAPAMAVADAR